MLYDTAGPTQSLSASENVDDNFSTSITIDIEPVSN